MIPIKDTIKSRHAPVMTVIIIIANVLVFIYQLNLPPNALNRFLYVWGVVPARFFRPGWAEYMGYPHRTPLPLFTSMFLHGGWFHLIANMWALWIFGDNVEDRMGHFRFPIFYILCGLIASAANMVLYHSSPIPTIGASGAIAGVMGAYFILFPGARILVLMPIFFYPLFFEIPAVVYLLFWFILQFLSGTQALLSGAGQVGGIAFWAHIAGFISGIILLRVFIRKRSQSETYNRYYA
ncbi:MAG: rhomboid family intramembrane serine protease [Candidatus Sumerlaeota bacterium]|nr:rhomboid family intramembrane serine protease [Candidatus Sumerlaeota bacterium]